MEDKYIGVILALAGAVANGFGFIIIKMVRQNYAFSFGSH